MAWRPGCTWEGPPRVFFHLNFFYWRAGVARAHTAALCAREKFLSVKEVIRILLTVRWHIVFVSEVGGDLRVFHGERVPTPRAAAN
jgi:hypothetical protein